VACGGSTPSKKAGPSSSAAASVAAASASSAPAPKPLRTCFDAGDELDFDHWKQDEKGASLCAHAKSGERSCWRVDLDGGWQPAPLQPPDAKPDQPQAPDRHDLATDPAGVKACGKVLPEKNADASPAGAVSADCKLAAVVTKDGKKFDLFDVATTKLVAQIPVWKANNHNDDELPRLSNLEFVDGKAILAMEDITMDSMAGRLFDLKGKKLADVGSVGTETLGDHVSVGTDLEAFTPMFQNKMFIIDVASGKEDVVDLSKFPQLADANGGCAVGTMWGASGKIALLGGKKDKLTLVVLGGDAHQIVDVKPAPICGAK
jgi:hypothetical protein